MIVTFNSITGNSFDVLLPFYSSSVAYKGVVGNSELGSTSIIGVVILIT